MPGCVDRAVVPLVECLLCMHKALGSVLSSVAMHTSVIPALERWKQEDQKVEVSLVCSPVSRRLARDTQDPIST